MLLAIDIGNTDTVVGVFRDKELAAHFRIGSNHALTADEAGLAVTSLLRHHIPDPAAEVSRVAVCSVVPCLTGIYERMTRAYFKIEPLIISARIKLPFKIDYTDPSEVGSDRLANAAAGYARYKSALVVVDIGTATTFDVVAESGNYLGGIIAPGPQTAGANLAQKAARLFEVRIEKPGRVIGKTTAEAIKSGLYYGTIALIDNVLERIFEEFGHRVPVIVTGGEAEIYAPDCKYVTAVVQTLTLEGIKLIADYNSLP
ncbi:MAG: type III pantothenate kinase [candidate division Zixibacteria bacterium]|nr:type III pantothenate kinase [candidate division Zixibacteria bacterium]